jgi:hypothetical protein
MASQADVRAVDNALMEPATVDTSLSFWERLKLAVTPESYAESIVNEIYSDPARTLLPDPNYDPRDFTSPAVYVQAKGAVSDALQSVSGFGTKALLYVAAFVLIAIAVYALVPALVRR